MHGLVTDKSILDNLQKVLSVISTKKYVFNIKILKTENNFTMINIKGHQFDVPLLLDKNKKYNLIIKDNIIQIEEVKEKVNPKVEISATMGQKWIRVEAVVVEDDRLEAKQSMLDAYPSLQGMYKAEDENTHTLYLKDVTATIYSFSDAPIVIKF